jgi:hypothetical protein
LGFSVEEWDALPWWQSRMYVECLSEELTGDAAPEEEEEPVEIDEQTAFETFGINVVKVNFGGEQ